MKTITSLCFALFIVASIASAQESVPVYGLLELSFDVNVPYDDPFDSDSIQIDAKIESHGNTISVPCFFDDTRGWKLRFAPSTAGEYSYTIIAKTSSAASEIQQGTFTAIPSDARGFVRIRKTNPRLFQFENGESYFPLGENMGWVSPPNLDTWRGYLQECGEAGINWIRIWMNSWGRTELEWTPQNGRYYGLGRYEIRNARMLDGILNEAENQGVYIQLVINHHGQYSSFTNPIWDENPYNTANGGFLERPQQFFTDARAKKHYRDRLRYLVGRWGYSTHLLAWEYWNEVDLTTGYNYNTVAAWQAEMSDYMDKIDPYRHLRSTSASGNFGGKYMTGGIDFIQSHHYIPRIIDQVMNTAQQTFDDYPQMPHIHGELSYDYRGPNRGDRDGVILHNQLWASVHSRDSGTAMTWWWDNWVRPYNLYYHFRAIANYIDGIDWVADNLQPMSAIVEPQPGNITDMIFYPGKGWIETDRQEFTVKSDGTLEGFDQMSSYVHGRAYAELAPSPILIVHNDQPSHFKMKIARVSRNGANCRIRLNHETVVTKQYAAQSRDYDPEEEGIVSIDLPAGENRIEIRNTGNDWFQIELFALSGFDQRIEVFVRGNPQMALVWVQDKPHRYAVIDAYSGYPDTQPTTVRIPGLTENEYIIEDFDTYKGSVTASRILASDENGLILAVPSFRRDMAFRIAKRVSAVEGSPSTKN